jgi:hypothetical protein
MRSLVARAAYLARLFAAAFTCSFISAGAATSQANEASGCNAALARDRVPTLRTTHQRWAYLNRIDQETFEQLKKDVEGGLSIPVVDLFIKASASYSEFVERREKFFQEINYTSDLAYEEPLLNLVTDPATYSAWAACMEQFAKRHVGFHAWKKMDRRDGIVVDYYWHAPVGVTSARAVSEITGGSVKDMPKGQAFPPGKRLRPNETGTIEIHGGIGAWSLWAALGAEGYGTARLLAKHDLREPIETVLVRLVFESEREVGPMESGATSVNNRNLPCGNASTCSPDRKWRASVIGLTVDAGEGRVLRGAHVTCVGMPPYERTMVEQLKLGNDQQRDIARAYEWAFANVCAHSQVTHAPVDGGSVVKAQVLSWGRPTHFVVRATAVEPQTTVDTTQRWTIESRATFVVRVPASASSAVVLARACGGESAATPGRNSPDKRLLYVGPISLEREVAYIYRYEPPRGPDGGLIHACGLPGVTGVNAAEAAARFNERYDLERRQQGLDGEPRHRPTRGLSQISDSHRRADNTERFQSVSRGN